MIPGFRQTSENSTVRQRNEATSNHTQRPEALCRRAERRLVSATRLLKRGRVIFLPPWLLFGAVIFLIVVKLIGSWTIASSSTTIASFLDTSEENSRSVGQAIADSLAFELDRIYQLHMMKNPWESPNQIHSLPLAARQPYERVGAISVAGVQLPLGELFVAVKPLFPHVRTYKTITGTIQKFPSGEKTYLARIIARLEEDGKIRKHWSVDRELTREAQIPDLVKELAFQIMWSTLEGIETRSFEAFKYTIEGIYRFRTYKDTHNLTDFLESRSHLQSAIAEDEKYVKAHFYLGLLYTWRAFYDKDGSQEFEKLARNEYENTAQSYTSKLHYSEVLGNFGLGLVAYRHYIKAKGAHGSKIKKDSVADPKLEEAYDHFQ
jgi:hypothetical protein